MPPPQLQQTVEGGACRQLCCTPEAGCAGNAEGRRMRARLVAVISNYTCVTPALASCARLYWETYKWRAGSFMEFMLRAWGCSTWAILYWQHAASDSPCANPLQGS